MSDQSPITHEQFKDAVKRFLFKQPDKSAVSEDYEPTQDELEEVFRVEEVPPDQQ